MAKLEIPTDLPYTLSKTQTAFVKKAAAEGYDIQWTYSGRGMFGTFCPGVVHPAGDFGFKGSSQDDMGRQKITYMER